MKKNIYIVIQNEDNILGIGSNLQIEVVKQKHKIDGDKEKYKLPLCAQISWEIYRNEGLLPPGDM